LLTVMVSVGPSPIAITLGSPALGFQSEHEIVPLAIWAFSRPCGK
jgi:hypothetical protein